MKFQTTIPIQKSDFLIDYSSKLVSFGSCFAENMGNKFHYFKFSILTNPFGIIFNPISLEKIILRSIQKNISQRMIFFIIMKLGIVTKYIPSFQILIKQNF